MPGRSQLNGDNWGGAAQGTSAIWRQCCRHTSGGGGDDPAADDKEPGRVIGIDDVDGHPRIASDVLGLLHAIDDVDHHMLAIGGHPGLSQLRRAVRHRRDEAWATAIGRSSRTGCRVAIGYPQFRIHPQLRGGAGSGHKFESVDETTLENMFDILPPDAAALADADDATVVSSIAGWAKVAAAAEAQRLAAIAELTQRRMDAAEHPDWACDDWDSAAAEIAAALNTGHGRAERQMDLALMLRDRFPKVGALLRTGTISARMVAVIATRTYLVQDAESLSQLDGELAGNAANWGPLSEYKLTQSIDLLVDRIDPGAVRRTRESRLSREFTVGDRNDTTGTTSVWGRLDSADAALLDQRLETMARGVCQDDPRTLAQRRADAVGAMAAHSDHLACRCDNPDCAAAADDGRASRFVVHVVTEQPVDRAKPALILSRRGGVLPGPTLDDLIAHGAKVRAVVAPGDGPQPQYRPSTALDEFIRMRDLTCRQPGCDRPAVAADIDHTIAYPVGATHPANLHCKCRKHHLLKTFWPGWSYRQLADGTVVVNSPTGHTYTTRPGSALFFPDWPIATATAPPTRDNDAAWARTQMMPRRKRTRAQTREHRIKAERALNDAQLAERTRPPSF